MRDQIKVKGIVLTQIPIGENDRRVVLLTHEFGKINAFAKGTRKPNSHLIGKVSPFTFGTFTLVVGRSSYTIVGITVENYFSKLREDVESAVYGMYLLEVADYYTRENNDEKEMLKLLYQSLKALEHPSYKRELVRCIFEWKAFAINGVVPPREAFLQESTSTQYTLQYIEDSPIEQLYRFTVTEEVLDDLRRIVYNYGMIEYDRPFNSFKVIQELIL